MPMPLVARPFVASSPILTFAGQHALRPLDRPPAPV
jgi:hypothetical protein